jgi:single-stranded-DNA-specific exonuclease
MSDNLPNQRWQIAAIVPEQIEIIVQSTQLKPIIAQVLINRGMNTLELSQIYIDPEIEVLPSPLEEFPYLRTSVELIVKAIEDGEKIAICGDYDADGMTSTALLLRALKHLDADVEYAIPSRMKDGYGINKRIVEEFAQTGITLILTVDNGISAVEPIALAVDLGLSVIVTDHHEPPETLPPADAILNPKLINPNSPYRGLAGVGVAYLLAIATAERLDKLQGLTELLLELYTLGTIADLAPLVGVNRRWLKKGLRQLPESKLAGIQALMEIGGVNEEQKTLKPDDIGFRLGPRINAVGRLADPQIVIDLLTTDDSGIALERAMQCEEINQRRQQLCEEIEKEAIAKIEQTPIDWQGARVLAIVNANWHHGVIGIVASRLVELYGVPVFIATYEEDGQTIRGSARGIEEFNIFDALEFSRDVLGKFGGHKAAGGFSLATENWLPFQEKLSLFAHQILKVEHLKPLVKIDALAHFEEINLDLYQQIDSLQPWGIANEFPIFWTSNVRIIEQKVVGNKHLKLVLEQDGDRGGRLNAIAWRWGQYCPLPNRVDIAYKLQLNRWQDETKLQLELVGVRLPVEIETTNNAIASAAAKQIVKKAVLNYQGRTYLCNFWESLQELRIKSDRGNILVVRRGQKTALLGASRDTAQEIDVTKQPYQQLVKAAVAALQI